MRVLGVGSRFSILMLAVAMLGEQAACSTGEAGKGSEGAPTLEDTSGVNGEGASSAPQQVVQRMVGKATAGAAQRPGAPVRAGAAEVVAGEARASAAGVSHASAGSLEPRSGSAQTITSKHLEAELNRLEAELAN